MKPIDPEQINVENAGKEWLELKAAAVGLRLQNRTAANVRARLRLSLNLNMLLGLTLLAIITVWKPALMLYGLAMAALAWIACALFIVGSTFLYIWRARLRHSRSRHFQTRIIRTN